MKKILGIICSGLYLFNAVIHLLLIFGAPLGEYVLGGYYIVSPLYLRFINLLFFLLWSGSAYIYLVYTNIIESKINKNIIRKVIIGITIFTTIAIFSNLFITSSIKERYLMTPLTLIVSVSSWIILLKNEKRKSPLE